MSEGDTLETKRRSMVTSLPSDYSDVQPKNYDPDYISHISNKMQVPDSIPAYTDEELFDVTLTPAYHDVRPRPMEVPERIMVAGGGEHIGGRPEITSLNLDGLPQTTYNEGVGLQTPPRTLTVEEQFPSLESKETDIHETPRRIPNGMAAHDSLTPVSGDSMMLHSGDEITQLRLQVERLAQRVGHLQSEQRALALYQHYTMMAGASLTALIFLYKLIT